MERRAFVLGGTGFVGRHVSRRLAHSDWDVTVGSRGETDIPSEVKNLRHVTVDRSMDDSLAAVVANGFDVLVDVIPYEPSDAQQIIDLRDRVGGVIAISTTSVYADDAGHTMDEAKDEETAPRMPVPILETQRRTEAGCTTYSTKKVAIEDILLNQNDIPATVIRPCAIYGPGDTQCREWFFVKRALDGRPIVLLADEGESVFHTTSVHNLAEMVRLAAELRVHGAFNCGDPDPPNVRRIAESIRKVVGHEWEEVLLPPEVSRDWAVRNPWGGFFPWIVSMAKAHDQLGYKPVTSYEAAIGEAVEWIVSATRGRDWRDVLSQGADYLMGKFDYETEDEFLEQVRSSP